MSQAEELLNMTENMSTYTTNPVTEEHINIDDNRIITVPERLRRIAVQYDHNVETVTFDCPRFWDEHDLSNMIIYVNYLRSDEVKTRYLAENVRIDSSDSNIIHFEWTITNDTTLVPGQVEFLVCAIKLDGEGNEELHWNSEINKQMYVSTGLEGLDSVYEGHIDLITDIIAMTKYENVKALVQRIEEVDSKAETDPTVPAHVKNITESDITNWNEKVNKSDLHEHNNKEILDTISQTSIDKWNNKSEFSGDYNDLSNKPTIPTATNQLTNNSNFISSTVVTAFWSGSQAAYDALGTYNPTTLYLIDEEG